MCLKPMTCDPSSRCFCHSTAFFENTTLICVEKFLNGVYCDRDWQCRSDLGLVCKNNKCACISSRFKWSGSKCLLTYAQTICNNNNECNNAQNLVCRLGNCTCERRSGREYYWNGQLCVEAKDVGIECSADIECKTITQNTNCLNSTCGCSNPTT